VNKKLNTATTPKTSLQPPRFALGQGAYGYRITSDGTVYWFDRSYESFAVKPPGRPIEACEEAVWPRDVIEECVFKSAHFRTPGSCWRDRRATA
jgi:hypothetical protein